MSQFDVKSPQHCAKQGFHIKRRYKKLLYFISTLLLSVVSIIFIIYFIVRPSKPEFSLKQVDIYQLNLSSYPQLVNSSVQLTLLSKNPNQRVGIYYDDLRVYASYKNQQITASATLPPFYQGHEDSNLLTASLVGTALPVAPSFGYEVKRDQTAGKLVLYLKANGHLRWKIWSWVSGKYRYNVNCVAVLPFGPSIPTGPLTTIQGTQCSTTV